MKLSHIVLAGALALASCSKKTESIVDKNSTAVQMLLKKYPQGTTFDRPNGKGKLIIRPLSPKITGYTETDKWGKVTFFDENGDGAVDFTKKTDGLSETSFRDKNYDGVFDEMKSVIPGTQKVVLEVLDTDEDFLIDKVKTPANPEISTIESWAMKEEIEKLLSETMILANQLYATVLEKVQ